MARERYILTLNTGSATIKWRLFHRRDLGVVIGGIIDRLHHKPSLVQWTVGDTTVRREVAGGITTVSQGLKQITTVLQREGFLRNQIVTVGHRVVHGGPDFTVPTRITPAVIAKLKKINILAPLHNPYNLEGVLAARRLFARARQVAVFDTAYFADLPVWARQYALPYRLTAKHRLRRYGFHGLSHQYVAEAAAEELGRPLTKLSLVTCHLGSGGSVAAIQGGQPIDVSMGFTPLEGLVMGTRSGDIDPGLLLYLARTEKYSIDALEKILNHESGLKGLSGFSDMRDVLTAAGLPTTERLARHSFTARERQRATLAVAVYVYRIQKYIGAYATILGGCDALIFTGGVAEQSFAIRQMIVSGLRVWKGLKTLVIPTDEEWMIARAAARA